MTQIGVDQKDQCLKNIFNKNEGIKMIEKGNAKMKEDSNQVISIMVQSHESKLNFEINFVNLAK